MYKVPLWKLNKLQFLEIQIFLSNHKVGYQKKEIFVRNIPKRRIFPRFYNEGLFSNSLCVLYIVASLIYMISKLKHWEKENTKWCNICIIIFYFVSYISPISAYVIDPPAWLKSGQALKGHEREQKESNKIEIEVLLEIRSKKIWIKFEYKKRIIRDFMNEDLEEFEVLYDWIRVLMWLLAT